VRANGWDVARLVAPARDAVSFGIGAYWGNYLIHQPPGHTEPWAWILAAGMMNLPLVTWADRLASRQRRGEPPSVNGTGPVERERSTP
jgi:hypothetical protein